MPRRKPPFKLIAVIVTAAWLSVIVFYLYQDSDYQRVVFLDVGQGDAVLLVSSNGQTVLVDGGPDRSILTALSSQLPWWDRRIDLMILTHPHADHLNGLNYVLENYQVGRIIATGVNHSSENYLAWLRQIKDQGIALEIMDGPRAVQTGDCQLQLIYPLTSVFEQTVDNLNNSSIVSRLACGAISFLLPGDLESEGENELLESGANLSSTVLKVGHHGSATATGDNWLKAVKPRIAVISLDKDNRYGFPHQETLDKLRRAEIEILRTDQQGTIELLTDGVAVWIK